MYVDKLSRLYNLYYIIYFGTQENAEVAQLESTLRAAGLREYEVLLEVQQLQDELIARRSISLQYVLVPVLALVCSMYTAASL